MINNILDSLFNLFAWLSVWVAVGCLGTVGTYLFIRAEKRLTK